MLETLAAPLRAAEDALLDALAVHGRSRLRHPIVLIVGAPRSGTTLLLQWLRATGHFLVPSNVMARFSAAPGVSARVQQVLFDPSFRFGDQLATHGDDDDAFHSDLGKTRGPLAPNEYAFFWRRHLGRKEIAPIGESSLASVDWARLRAELAAIECAFDLPLATKGQFLQYDLPYVVKHLSEALFIHVRRDALFNAQSLLTARERFHGDTHRWYSSRPPGSDRLDDEPPEVQVAGQVALDNRAIELGLSAVPDGRQMTLGYEAFCMDTRVAWTALRERFADLGHTLPSASSAPERFNSSNRLVLAGRRLEALQAAVKQFESEPPQP